MFSLTNVLRVVQMPTSEQALQDTVYLNPANYAQKEETLCRISDMRGNSLIFPAKIDHKIQQGKIALNSRQRKTLHLGLNDSAQISFVYRKGPNPIRLGTLPRITKVWLSGISARGENEAIPVRKIIAAFYDRYHSHPLNTHHTIPLDVDRRIYYVFIHKLKGEVEEKYGVMNTPCEVVYRESTCFHQKHPLSPEFSFSTDDEEFIYCPISH